MIPGRVAIYALRDPDGVARYVGRSSEPYRRFHGHLFDAAREGPRHQTEKCRWLRGLLDDGGWPKLDVLEWVDEAEGPDAERRWIATFAELGAELMNMTAGG